MIRQIRYFQSVVRNNSFSEAAEECHISQSAISQQIQALERELGFYLLERKNRKFVLTPAGEYFYKKSLVLVADYEQMCREAGKLAKDDKSTLVIGYLRCYSGQEFHLALEEFSAKYPDVSVKIEYGNHEELYELLRTGSVDLVLNDQRRAFSDQYVNLILTVGKEYIEISSRNPIALLPSVTPQELKNVPCILVASRDQRENEQAYYQGVVGFQGDFFYAENLEEARLMVIGGQGFMPVEGVKKAENLGSSISRIPLFRGDSQITRNYCAFWKRENSDYYVEEFADILKRKFE
ncbi:MAG: LysR family transcriptional regulator [Lachnospiraceae bacterium]|nr:LysR family transcriptional regulator [Lachnospiraceae bacterium]